MRNGRRVYDVHSHSHLLWRPCSLTTSVWTLGRTFNLGRYTIRCKMPLLSRGNHRSPRPAAPEHYNLLDPSSDILVCVSNQTPTVLELQAEDRVPEGRTFIGSVTADVECEGVWCFITRLSATSILDVGGGRHVLQRWHGSVMYRPGTGLTQRLTRLSSAPTPAAWILTIGVQQILPVADPFSSRSLSSILASGGTPASHFLEWWSRQDIDLPPVFTLFALADERLGTRACSILDSPSVEPRHFFADIALFFNRDACSFTMADGAPAELSRTGGGRATLMLGGTPPMRLSVLNACVPVQLENRYHIVYFVSDISGLAHVSQVTQVPQWKARPSPQPSSSTY